MEQEKIETCKEYNLRKMQKKKRATWKTCRTKIVQYEQSATCKLCNLREEQYWNRQHRKPETEKESNIKRDATWIQQQKMKYKKVLHEKHKESATSKESNAEKTSMKIVQYEKGATWN